MTPTEPIESRLASVLRRPLTLHQGARLDERLTSAREQQRPAARPGWRPGRKAVLLLAVLLVVPLAAAGSIIGGGTESPAGLVDAAGYRAELEEARGVVTIPPTATWPPIVLDGSGYYSRTGGRSDAEFVAFCLWTDSWLGAYRDGALAGARRALERMRAYRAWTGSDVFAGQSFRDSIDMVVGAAEAGRSSVVSRFSRVNCLDS